MSSTVAIMVLLNNYVHDVATGLLILSALWLGWSAKDLGATPSPETLGVFRRSYRRCLHFVFGSIGLIVATGVVRFIYFMELEWFPALGKGLIPILVTKHILIGVMLTVGGFAWVHLRRRLRTLPGWKEAPGPNPGG